MISWLSHLKRESTSWSPYTSSFNLTQLISLTSHQYPPPLQKVIPQTSFSYPHPSLFRMIVTIIIIIVFSLLHKRYTSWSPWVVLFMKTHHPHHSFLSRIPNPVAPVLSVPEFQMRKEKKKFIRCSFLMMKKVIRVLGITGCDERWNMMDTNSF